MGVKIMLKKFFILFMCCILLTSCEIQQKKGTPIPLTDERIENAVEPKEGERPEAYAYRSQQEDISWYTDIKNLVDEKMALNIAIAVMKNTNADFLQKPTVCYCSYQEDMDAYVIEFVHEEKSQRAKTEQLKITISRQNGAILETDDGVAFNGVDEKMSLDITIGIIRSINDLYFNQPTIYYNSYREDLNAYFVCIFEDSDHLIGSDIRYAISRKDGAVIARWS